MIDPITGWFNIPQYNDKREISIANLVDTMWLGRYHRTIEITYEKESDE